MPGYSFLDTSISWEQCGQVSRIQSTMKALRQLGHVSLLPIAEALPCSTKSQFGQQNVDLANASLKMLYYITPSSGIDWESKKSAWEYLNQQQDAILGYMKDIEMPTAIASASTARSSPAGPRRWSSRTT